jgi:hypothetical protein
VATAAAEVLQVAAGALTSGDPLQAEHYASHLLSPVLDMRWDDDPAAEHALPATADAMAQVRDPELLDAAAALVVALHSFAQHRAASPFADGEADDRAAFISEVLRKLQVSGAVLPEWSGDCGRPAIIGAYMARDVWGDQVSLYLGFEYTDQEPHSITALIDHNIDGILKDVFIGGPVDDLIESWQEQVLGDPRAAELMRLEPIEPAHAVRLLLDALEITNDTPTAEVSHDLRQVLALLESRLILLADTVEGQVPEELPAASALEDIEDPEELLEPFLASREYAAEPKASPEAARQVVSFATDAVSGGPTRFSAAVAYTFLVDYLPHTAEDAMRAELIDSAIPTARAWARFCVAARDLPEAALTQTLEAIDAIAPQYTQLMSQPPAPTGHAARLVEAMQQAGLDPSDQGDLDEWMERFNSLPYDERGRILGLDDGHMSFGD